ncbi:hypothetical protein HC928_23075 [bacterium]|nr:hypothetical protein [bacterium]
MKVHRPHAQEPTPEDIQHLDKLKATVELAMRDGKLSKEEIDGIQTVLFEDGKVTAEELATIKRTIRSVIGEGNLEYEWW